jgi:radical SAM superfamily enzyme YgiQ (UPF0313 family)
MRVLLVKPISLAGYQATPDLGLGYLATALGRTGQDVTILDCQKERTTTKGWGAIVARGGFDVVGFKVFSGDMARVEEQLYALKAVHPDVLALVGGPHVSGDPQWSLEAIPHADYGFVGEAEIGLPRFLRTVGRKGYGEDCGSLESIPGLARRKNGQVVVNPPLIHDRIDDFGIPCWDLMQPATYPDETFGVFVRSFPTASIITTRGCPYRCTYCGGFAVTGRRLRKRSTALVIEEMRLLRDQFKVRDITIVDDNFTMDRDYAASICQAMLDGRLGVSWSCPNGVRVDSLNVELLRLMERSGCYSIALGIESGSQRILDSMGKKLNLTTVREKVRLIRSATHIKMTGFFMIGYPDETRNDIEATLRLSRELPVDRASFPIFSPLPGTEIYHRLLDAGIIHKAGLKPEMFWIDGAGVPIQDMNPSQVKWMQRKAVLRFYLRPRILWGLAREIRSASQIRIIAGRLWRVISG